MLSAPSSTSCKPVLVGGSLTVCSHLEVECYKRDHADGNLFGLLVLAIEVELEDGIPVGHCSQECDYWGHGPAVM